MLSIKKDFYLIAASLMLFVSACKKKDYMQLVVTTIPPVVNAFPGPRIDAKTLIVYKKPQSS